LKRKQLKKWNLNKEYIVIITKNNVNSQIDKMYVLI
jgi:hypothetical protein